MFSVNWGVTYVNSHTCKYAASPTPQKAADEQENFIFIFSRWLKPWMENEYSRSVLQLNVAPKGQFLEYKDFLLLKTVTFSTNNILFWTITCLPS